jgi:hypothetical protein
VFEAKRNDALTKNIEFTPQVYSIKVAKGEPGVLD